MEGKPLQTSLSLKGKHRAPARLVLRFQVLTEAFPVGKVGRPDGVALIRHPARGFTRSAAQETTACSDHERVSSLRFFS
jgi:hypothetical protein